MTSSSHLCWHIVLMYVPAIVPGNTPNTSTVQHWFTVCNSYQCMVQQVRMN